LAPTDPSILFGLISYYREVGESARVLTYARKLLVLEPTNPELQQLVQQLEGPTG